MTALVFVDSNVLIYAVDEGDPRKNEAARLWRSELWKSGNGRLSFQVLQEFYVNVTRKFPAGENHARAEVRNLLAWQPIGVNGGILEDTWKIQGRFKLSFWDAMIVSAAKAASCRYLLTEDLQEGQEMDGVVVVNPFQVRPREIQ